MLIFKRFIYGRLQKFKCNGAPTYYAVRLAIRRRATSQLSRILAAAPAENSTAEDKAML